MKAKDVVITGLMVAVGIILPQAFHVFGTGAGNIFLPIQYGVFLTGMLVSPVYGGIAGMLIPVLSSLLTGMPPVPKVYFMIPELVTYGIVTGLFIKVTTPVKALVIAMVTGRAVYGAALIMGMFLFEIKAPFMNVNGFIYSMVMGIPGLLIQLLVLPIIYKKVSKGIGSYANGY